MTKSKILAPNIVGAILLTRRSMSQQSRPSGGIYCECVPRMCLGKLVATFFSIRRGPRVRSFTTPSFRHSSLRGDLTGSSGPALSPPGPVSRRTEVPPGPVSQDDTGPGGLSHLLPGSMADHRQLLVSRPRCSVFGPWTSSIRTSFRHADFGHTFISSSSRVSSCSRCSVFGPRTSSFQTSLRHTI